MGSNASGGSQWSIDTYATDDESSPVCAERRVRGARVPQLDYGSYVPPESVFLEGVTNPPAVVVQAC